jgi:hypothetical protein
LIACLLRIHQTSPRAGLVSAPERSRANPGRADQLGGRWLPLRSGVRWLFANAQAELPPAFEVEIASGCALLLSRVVAESIGLFDEQFFAYWEDVDLSLRVRAAGYHNYCATETHVLHKSASSTGGWAGPNQPLSYLLSRGQALIVRKHARGLPWLTSTLRMIAVCGLAVLRAAVRSSYRPQMQAKLCGARDGWLGRPPDARWIKR